MTLRITFEPLYIPIFRPWHNWILHLFFGNTESDHGMYVLVSPFNENLIGSKALGTRALL